MIYERKVNNGPSNASKYGWLERLAVNLGRPDRDERDWLERQAAKVAKRLTGRKYGN